MQLKFLQNIVQAQDPSSKVVGLCWSPNNLKLAVATADRVILLFDDSGERKDKFSLKPADSKFGKKSFEVKGIAFSPDSTKIAVAQTDNIVYVYKIGEDWGDKKVICNKFIVSSSVTCLIWLLDGPLIFGTADGKVSLGNCKNNKPSTLYGTDSFVVSLSSKGTGFLSGHADGTVVRYYVSDDSSMDSQGRVATSSSAPYALVWTLNHILAAGCDKKVTIYEKDGKISRTLDYSKEDEKEFTMACCSPSGQAVAVGSFDRIRLYSWNPPKNVWEENISKEIKNMYTVTALSWKRDGSKLACGTLCGGVLLFESVLKRTVWKNKFEMAYVGPSQVLVKPLNSSERGIILKSQFGYEIDDVRIMGKDRYLLARTLHTILLGDIQKNLLSEVVWPNSGRNEKFYFDNANVCLIFNVGELTLVEYGENEILGSVRTEFMNPHLISVRLNERRTPGSVEDNKKLAYLLDLKTICIIDLVYGVTVAHVSHDAKVDWLELNETGHKLLFRDKKQRLMLLDLRTGRKEAILTNCTFVQWVPGSDVVVAQSLNNLCVWYNIDTPERVTLLPVKGEVVDVVREGKTEVVVQEGMHQLSYELDEGMVEFGTAIHDKDFGRAVLFLEKLGDRSEAEGMWQNLASIALNTQQLKVASRCFAALGNISKTHFLNETIRIGEEFGKKNGSDELACPEVWVRLALLNKELKAAEQVYMEQNDIDKAIELYQKFHKWEEALTLASSRGHMQSEELREKHMKWLIESHQEEKAGELKEKEGDHLGALNLYLSAKQPGKSARLLQNYTYLLENEKLVEKVISSLIKTDMLELAGTLYEKLNNFAKALECYRKGKAFGKAVDLAKRFAPNEIKNLEEQWGNWLSESKQWDAAINHYIEAGKTVKALEAAVNGRQWKKSVQIIQVIDKVDAVAGYYQVIGEHFRSIKDYQTAEAMLLKCGMYNEVIEMYNSVGQWEKAHSVACEYLDSEEVSAMYLSQARTLENSGKLKEAEKLLTSISKPDMAISMYKKHRQYDNMMRLVEIYHPELVTITHKHLAQELEAGKQYKLAENHYLLASEWKAAINMYHLAEMWDEAYRIAKSHGGPEACQQVAFVWAKSLGGEAAVKLLNRFNLLEQCIDYACQSYQFDFALELAQHGMSSKLPLVHYKFAMALEDGGKFTEAEEQFLKAAKPKEAILMYIHAREWERAEQVAEKYDRDSLSDVLLAQAKDLMEKRNISEIESLLLRAQKPEMLVKYYQDNDMWVDALRICKEYLPTKLPALQSIYDRQVGNKGSRDITTVLSQAREWEQNGQFKQAIQCYIKISTLTSDRETILSCLLKASDLTSKFVERDDAVIISRTVGPKLLEMQQYGSAAQLYMSCDLMKEAIDSFIKGGEWSKARKIANEYEPGLEMYVENRYKEHLTAVGDVDQLSDVDATAALDLWARQGSWAQCLEAAKQHGSYVLHKYVAVCATQLIKDGNTLQALALYNKYEAPALPQNYNIYKRICADMLGTLETNGVYDHWAQLRNMLFNLTENIRHSQEADSATHNEFETLLAIAHYYATRSAFKEIKGLQVLAMKISVALLRYTDVIPPDKGFYEAGVDARAVGRENEAFVFLNHYLDICEAIDEGSSEMIDPSDFSATDFPLRISLPAKHATDTAQHEEVKDWVLSVSMDQRIDQVLPLDDRNLYESSLTSINSTEAAALPCVVTGYPVLRSSSRIPIEFKYPGKAANREDWNTLVMTAKTSVGSHLNDVITFIVKPPVVMPHQGNEKNLLFFGLVHMQGPVLRGDMSGKLSASGYDYVKAWKSPVVVKGLGHTPT